MHDESTLGPDWADMRGQYHAKRMLEIAASGSHSMLLVGPPLAGMAVMARSLMTILPACPFLAPHPATDSLQAAVEQARGGMLFLEDLGRWDDLALALLREIAFQQPGQFLLVATTSYCPCGNSGDEVRQCACLPAAVETYRERLASTVDACFAIEAFIPSINSLASVCPDEPSRAVRERVTAVRLIQSRRNGAEWPNGALSLTEVEECSPLDAPAQRLVAAAHAQLSLSPQQGLFLLQVARTVADMASLEANVSLLRGQYVAEAIQYRPRWTRGTA
jgi:magnesium chelatase family protein